MGFRTAQRQAKKLRIGISGQSGSGKTIGALRLAFGLCGDWTKVGVLDTENNSGTLYSHLGPYQHMNLEKPFSPERYSDAIKQAQQAGILVLIMDTATHEWTFCKEEADRLAQSSPSKNTFMAWGKVTPRHVAFVESIINAPMHMITTVRLKTEWSLEKDEKGRTTPTKLGMKEEQRDGFEYELDVAFRLVRDGHWASADKDRTELFPASRPPFKLTEDAGRELGQWSQSGESPEPPYDHTSQADRDWLKPQIAGRPAGEQVTIAKALHGRRRSELAAVISALTVAGQCGVPP